MGRKCRTVPGSNFKGRGLARRKPRVPRENVSGREGVTFDHKTGKWLARLTWVDASGETRRTFLGLYDSMKDACEIYDANNSAYEEWRRKQIYGYN